MTGSIQVRTLKNGQRRYHAVWRAGGKQRRKAFTRKKDAERFLAETVKKVHDGSWQEVRPALMRDVFDAWLRYLDTREREGNIKPSTAGNYRGTVAKHFAPLLGEYRSDQLTVRTMDVWRRRMLDRGVSAKTFNNTLGLLGTVFKWARQRGYLAHDPLLGQERRPLPEREAAILERDDLAALLGAASTDPRDNAAVHLAVFGGLRRGEIFALRWKDVDGGDGLGGRVHVRCAWSAGVLTTPKSKKSRRAVDVPRRVLDALAQHRQANPGDDDDFIFRTRAGTPVNLDNWYKRRFVRMCAAAGIEATCSKTGERGAPVGLHTLRHTYASLLLAQGEQLMYVSRQLGHASIQITVDTYGHLLQETRAEAMDRLNDAVPAAPLRAVWGAGA